MNLILLDEKDISNRQATVTDSRAKHIINVLRAEPGDSIRVGVVNGRKGIARVTAMAKKHPRSVKLSLELNEQINPLPRIDLVLAMPRPIMLRRIFSQATALGVGSFFMIQAGRVEKSFWEASLIDGEGYRQHLLHGLEQAMDTRVPEVSFHRRFKPFVEDYLPTIVARYSACLVMHPQGSYTLLESGINSSGRILLAIGPEGGWLEYEVEKFVEAGFLCCSIGERILKVDTAVVAIHARLSQILEM